MNLYQILTMIVGVTATTAIIILTTTAATTLQEKHQLTCCVVEQDYNNAQISGTLDEVRARYKADSFQQWFESDHVAGVTKDCRNMPSCPSLLGTSGLYVAPQPQP